MTETCADVKLSVAPVTSLDVDLTADVQSLVGDTIEFENRLKCVNFTLVRESSEVTVITSPSRNISDVLFGGISYVLPKEN